MDIRFETQRLHTEVLKRTCLTFGTVTFVFAVINVFYGSLVLFAIEIGFSWFSWHLFKTTQYRFVTRFELWVYVAWVALIVISCLFVYPDSFGTFIWLYCLPAVYHTFLQRKIANGASGVTYLVMLAALINSQQIFHSFDLLNSSLFYLSVWMLIGFHDDQRRKMHRRLHQAAHEDPLTLAKNRLALKSDFDAFSRQRNQVKLFHVDIDHFKTLNDSYGHGFGDKVLVVVVKQMQDLLGAQHVYRIGGDELFAMLPNDETDDHLELANRIVGRVASYPFKSSSEHVSVSVSVGTARCIPSLLTDIDEALRLSDRALYIAKSQGRNQAATISGLRK